MSVYNLDVELLQGCNIAALEPLGSCFIALLALYSLFRLSGGFASTPKALTTVGSAPTPLAPVGLAPKPCHESVDPSAGAGHLRAAPVSSDIPACAGHLLRVARDWGGSASSVVGNAGLQDFVVALKHILIVAFKNSKFPPTYSRIASPARVGIRPAVSATNWSIERRAIYWARGDSASSAMGNPTLDENECLLNHNQ